METRLCLLHPGAPTRTASALVSLSPLFSVQVISSSKDICAAASAAAAALQRQQQQQQQPAPPGVAAAGAAQPGGSTAAGAGAGAAAAAARAAARSDAAVEVASNGVSLLVALAKSGARYPILGARPPIPSLPES
eukprot:345320-Chlamydomonas_euryale.AAC.1